MRVINIYSLHFPLKYITLFNACSLLSLHRSLRSNYSSIIIHPKLMLISFSFIHGWGTPYTLIVFYRKKCHRENLLKKIVNEIISILSSLRYLRKYKKKLRNCGKKNWNKLYQILDTEHIIIIQMEICDWILTTFIILDPYYHNSITLNSSLPNKIWSITSTTKKCL